MSSKGKGKGKGVASSSSLAEGKAGEEVEASQVEGNVLGSIIWVKSHDESWWPAQVVDENTISGSAKPGTKSEGQILVRLYGSYTYWYVDPVKCRAEFDIVLKENNGSCREIFQKALEQDLLQLKSGQSKGQELKSKDVKAGTSKDKKSNQNQAKKRKEIGSSDHTSDPTDEYHGTGGRNTRAKKAEKSEPRPGVRSSARIKSMTAKQDDQQKQQKPATSSAEQGEGKKSKRTETPKELKPSHSRGVEIKDKTPKQEDDKPSRSRGVEIKDKTPKQEDDKPSRSRAVEAKGKTPKQESDNPSGSSSEERKDKTPMQDKDLKKNIKPSSSSEPSARKKRVMQRLGLAAPPGSPFHKNGDGEGDGDGDGDDVDI